MKKLLSITAIIIIMFSSCSPGKRLFYSGEYTVSKVTKKGYKFTGLQGVYKLPVDSLKPGQTVHITATGGKSPGNVARTDRKF